MRFGGRTRPYEVTLLNDLHEILPELLYDSEMFPGTSLRFLQTRVGHMFPVYHRERGIYLREQSDSRRSQHRTWRTHSSPFSSRVPTRASRAPTSIVQTIGRISSPIVATYSTDEGTTSSSTQVDAFLRNLILAITTGEEEEQQSDTMEPPTTPPPTATRAPIRILRRSTLGTNQAERNSWWDAVPVHPTPSMYAASTEVVDPSGVPTDTICTICQSNQYEVVTGQPIAIAWRRLRNCSHQFHSPCADQWFSLHITCPICRQDIRIADTGATSSTAER